MLNKHLNTQEHIVIPYIKTLSKRGVFDYDFQL